MNMVTSMSLGVLKEPRGFIRILQVILAIFAFATTCSVSTSVKFKVSCANSTQQEVTVPFSYPFDLHKVSFQVSTCEGGSGKQDMKFESGSVSSSQFFVAVGVLAFLYSLAAIVLYVFFDDLYRKENKIIIGDFVVTAVFALFWLISSAAWADGLSDVKYNTDPKTGIFPSSTACKPPTDNTCTTLRYGDFSSLNVSIIFGFLNMVVWGGNIWFLYKETPWFKGDSSSNYNPDSQMPQGSMGGSPTQPSAT
ncbi:synaptophysin-like isoform X2 [Liolophura sinensis]|uniref:synaptophysin-like isoform X2 n=1 Tax=Liolophura sinensis TaxID=3198878 RepID=UPI003159199A